jgi:hypothetical protein
VSKLTVPPPSHFVSHAPMACEALDALGLDEALEAWVEGSEKTLIVEASPVASPWGSSFDWERELGRVEVLPQWMGYFSSAIASDGWSPTVALWVPRLMPGLSAALFHGVIRTSHAVRAIRQSDVPERRDELARALAHWAVWFRPGAPSVTSSAFDAPGEGVLAAACVGVGHFVSEPSIRNLHGVTGAMAVHLLSGHLAEGDARASVAQLVAEHEVLFAGQPSSGGEGDDAPWDDKVVATAARSFDPHQVKMVEACRRGFELTGDSGFILGARVVTRQR